MEAVQQRLCRLCVGSLNDTQDELGELLGQDWEPLDSIIEWSIVLNILEQNITIDDDWTMQEYWDPDHRPQEYITMCHAIVQSIMDHTDSEGYASIDPRVISFVHKLKRRFEVETRVNKEFLKSVCAQLKSQNEANNFLSLLQVNEQLPKGTTNFSTVTQRTIIDGGWLLYVVKKLCNTPSIGQLWTKYVRTSTFLNNKYQKNKFYALFRWHSVYGNDYESSSEEETATESSGDSDSNIDSDSSSTVG